MADILIRGMEMPKHCDECPFSQYRVENLYNYCMVLKRLFAEPYKRLDNCPLHELPPHGDLIDRNATIEESEKPTIFDLTDVSDFLHEQPVVIPSNKENKNAN